jgi:hypothetical protein
LLSNEFSLRVGNDVSFDVYQDHPPACDLTDLLDLGLYIGPASVPGIVSSQEPVETGIAHPPTLHLVALERVECNPGTGKGDPTHYRYHDKGKRKYQTEA